MNGLPNIVLMQGFSIRSDYKTYLSYMTRKEAIKGKEYLDEKDKKELLLINRKLEQQGYFTNREEKTSYENDPADKDKKVSPEKIINDDYGKYIGYMMRSNALAKVKKLTPEQVKEKARVDKAAAKIIEGHINKADDTLIGWYSSEHRNLKLKDKESVASKLREAENNGSVLWNPVVSFDNDYLIREGILDPKTDELHDDILKDASYKMMEVAAKKEGLNQPFWTASIHRNTDNIHIHFALVEKANSREIINYDGRTEPKAKFKLSTVYAMKSAFSNTLVNQELTQDRITKDRNKIRESVVRNAKEELQNPNFQKMLNSFIKELPTNRQKWQYATLHKINPKLTDQLDKITGYLLKDDKHFQEWSGLVKDLDEMYKGQYGKTENPRKHYADNEFKDLQKRTGNKLLTELKTIDQQANNGKIRLPKIDPSKADNYILECLNQIESRNTLNVQKKVIPKRMTTSIADRNRRIKQRKNRQRKYQEKIESYKEDQHLKKLTRPILNKHSINYLKNSLQKDFENNLTTYDKVRAMQEFNRWHSLEKDN